MPGELSRHLLAVSLNNNAVEVVEVPRPQIEQPGDAILMVTTAAIGHWEIAAASGNGASATPGTQFAGIVVETGTDVAMVGIDDLVVARGLGVLPGRPGDEKARFGSESLAGGHAEYVRVPLADQTLVTTHPAAEERAVFAGGEAAMGFRAAGAALDLAGDGPIYWDGCDAAGLSALARIKQVRCRKMNVLAGSDSAGPCAPAIAMGAVEIGSIEELPETAAAITTSGSLAGVPHFSPHFPGIEDATALPTLEETRRAESLIRLRQVDLTPIVSTVLPLDEAAEAYRIAIERPSGTRAVLLKP